MRFCGSRFLLLIVLAFTGAARLEAASPVWKVTDDKGHTLFLGGSIHAMRGSEGAIPTAFGEALAKSSHLVFEAETETKSETEKMRKSGEYPAGDSLKNHVDPRTYDYLKRFFGLIGMPEAKMARYRPWLLTIYLWSPELRGMSSNFGVESRLTKQARAKGKKMSGLVSWREQMEVFTGLSERQSEAVLLMTFIPTTSNAGANMMSAWRRGDVDSLWRQTRGGFAEYPSFGERLLEARNRRWMPKVESLLQGGEACFVVVGAAHLGGPEGLLNLLKQRGYQLEQL